MLTYIGVASPSLIDGFLNVSPLLCNEVFGNRTTVCFLQLELLLRDVVTQLLRHLLLQYFARWLNLTDRQSTCFLPCLESHLGLDFSNISCLGR